MLFHSFIHRYESVTVKKKKPNKVTVLKRCILWVVMFQTYRNISTCRALNNTHVIDFSVKTYTAV